MPPHDQHVLALLPWWVAFDLWCWKCHWKYALIVWGCLLYLHRKATPWRHVWNSLSYGGTNEIPFHWWFKHSLSLMFETFDSWYGLMIDRIYKSTILFMFMNWMHWGFHIASHNFRFCTTLSFDIAISSFLHSKWGAGSVTTMIHMRCCEDVKSGFYFLRQLFLINQKACLSF